jgi:hypothetical protein
MGKRKRDANGKIVYDRPSDLKPRPDRKRPGRRNGSEYVKTEQKRVDQMLALEMQPELGLRKCTTCHVTTHMDSFPVPASTSTIQAYKTCTACLDYRNELKLANGITSFIAERDAVRSLGYQSYVKANLFGTEGYEAYAAACLQANLEKTPGVQRPRRELQEMEEKTQNHGMFALILS